MSYACLYTRAKVGINAPLVTVEVHISAGLPAFSLVGLPAAAVRESKERVRSALINSGFQFPMQRLTVNLAPADLPKEGGRYDLAIALGILCATKQLKGHFNQLEFIGELALSGSVCAVSGVLPMAIACKALGRGLYLPQENITEASLVEHAALYPSKNLAQVHADLLAKTPARKINNPVDDTQAISHAQDIADVKGQYQAKRALEIAAAGGHHMLMLGSPGTGKTMLASRLPTILPLLTEEQAIETVSVESVAGIAFAAQSWRLPRLRNPHHSISAAALIGGGSRPKPGEVSLAHFGVLFLDELAEFARHTLDQLREPMESGVVHISRANMQVSYPARFQLVAAMNPVDIEKNYAGHSPFGNKISQPLLDRIDIQIEVRKIDTNTLMEKPTTAVESSADVRARVIKARALQAERGCLNAVLSGKMTEQVCLPSQAARQLLKQAMQQLGMSARAYHKVLKIARTIADLEGNKELSETAVAEALGYRFVATK